MIRQANAFDLPELIDLGERMHAESPRFSRLTFSRARLHDSLRMLLDNPLGFVWVAEEDRLIGGMVAIASPHWASHDLIATDLALFIDPARRGTLAPVRLINRYLGWGREIGAVITQVGCTTGVETEKTAQLFERLGMTRCGVILEA